MAAQPFPVAASAPYIYPLNPSPLTPAQAAIPARVACSVPISIRSSLVHPDMKGLYVDHAVSSGDILFTIKRPLFTVVTGGENLRQRTCDNCFAYQSMEGQEEVVSNVEKGVRAEIIFTPCEECRVVYYCSSECEIEAHGHHHQYECSALKTVLDTGRDDITEDRDIRFTIRLLCLVKGGRLTGAELEEFFKTPTGASFHFRTKDRSEHMYDAMKDFLKKVTESSLTEDEIKHILCIPIRQYIPMPQTILRKVDMQKGSSWNKDTSNKALLGKCVDPFMVVMRNDCNANTRAYFDGVTYILQANCAMPANTEITRRFLIMDDYQNRRAELMAWQELDCNCALCLRGDLGPKIDLRPHMLSIYEFNFMSQDDKLLDEKLQSDFNFIEYLEYKRFGFDCPGMRKLYLVMFYNQSYRDSRLGTNDYKISMKLLLVIYYFIDPVACPAPLPDERIQILYLLISVAMSIASSANMDKKNALRIRRVIFHWRTKLVEYSKQMGGPDTKIARFYDKEFKRDIKSFNMHAFKSKDALTEDMNFFFGLLSLEEITYEQISRT
ncbi:SET domain-containing protein 5 [Ciborinia camelliae]|nr:SET domain-containing protein 5 [Ciborinia camelliae]